MIIKEFRVVMPMTVDEYQVAQLYSVAQASKNETGGGEGIEVLKNDPFTATTGIQPDTPLLDSSFKAGQFTHKIYHLASKVPLFIQYLLPPGSLNLYERAWNCFPYCRTVLTSFLPFLSDSKVPGYIRWLAPAGSLEVHEVAWNAYPYCRTLITNPEYMKNDFFIKIETMHLGDNGTTENAHKLSSDVLKKREVVMIDIANDSIEPQDYKPDQDPTKYKSQKTERGPLVGSWMGKVSPVMCCYKLVSIEFKWFGLQNRVEKFIQKSERRLFTNFHRGMFCWTDQWYGLTMADIRTLEEKTKKDLDEQIRTGEVRGLKETN